MYFQEWPSGLVVPGCSVEMGGRAANIDNTPSNILSPQAPSQNVAPQVPLAVNTCPPQAQINILSPGQSSVMSSPSVESISPVAPWFLGYLYNPRLLIFSLPSPRCIHPRKRRKEHRCLCTRRQHLWLDFHRIPPQCHQLLMMIRWQIHQEIHSL